MNHSLPSGDALPIRVLLVAEDSLVRANLAGIVEADPGLLLVGQLAPQAAPLAISSSTRPEVVLWDAGWRREAGEGWEALALAGAAVVLLVSDEDSARGAWEAGVRGVLSRAASPRRIQTALAAAGLGLAVRDPSLPGPPADRRAPGPRPSESLTERELEVLRHVGEGLSNKEIALRLAISESTVKFHVNAILGKLDAQSRTEAAMIAARAGLIPL